MVFKDVFELFAKSSPVCVMVRAALENLFAPSKLNELFAQTAVRQYTRELLFSTMVDLMSLVTCRIHPSFHRAYQARRQEIGVSSASLYEKLNGTEAGVSQALVRYSATHVGSLIKHMKADRRPLLPGYRTRILDGNHLRGSDHRLQELRGTGAGALPGQALVLMDPQQQLIVDVFPCEDGHAQERSLLSQVLPVITEKMLVIADRNFCTTQFLFGIWRKKAFFLIRQHSRNLVWEKKGQQRFAGKTSTGRVYEQEVILTDRTTQEKLRVRRITVKLKKPTRDGDVTIHLLTNVPAKDASAAKIADLYLRRWNLETAFQELTVHLRCEVKSLGYPRAALFAFCVAVACYNIMAVVKAGLRAVHGETKVEEGVSNYYLTEEISAVYRGMMIALPPVHWEMFQDMTIPKLARVILHLAESVKLEGYQKHPRGPKKPQPKRKSAQFHHVSTAKLLDKRKKTKTKARKEKEPT